MTPAGTQQRTLHIAPGDAAVGSLLQAIREAGSDDDVLRWPDDLSCGPIEPDDPSIRAAWWAPFHRDQDVAGKIVAFWDRAAATQDGLVVWFGRHAASELAFFLAWAERLGARPYDIVDVTGLRLPFTRQDGTVALSGPTPAAAMLSADDGRSLLGAARPVPSDVREEARQRWRRLRDENAPFRVVTERGLESAPADIFDPLLLEQTTGEWRPLVRVIGDTMGLDMEPYWQVGDAMLRARVVTLIAAGRLLAEGDPQDMRSCRVRRAD